MDKISEPRVSWIDPLPAPPYWDEPGAAESCVALAVESMKRHTTDEGWQIMAGLEHAGYQLWGHGLEHNETDVAEILKRTNPDVLVLQDKREWDVQPRDFRDPAARFTNVGLLADREDIFKITILKDAHQRPDYHRQSANEIGVHAWIIYYEPVKVAQLAPYVRPEHLIRTYHTVDADLVPVYSAKSRSGSLLSGAVSGAYPLRKRIANYCLDYLPNVVRLDHPGYHRDGCATPKFLKLLTQFKVAICTASIYGYALRKIIEATACGCVVVTDLPVSDRLPAIDDNLVRISPDIDMRDLRKLLSQLCDTYNPDRQQYYNQQTVKHYDYRHMGRCLEQSINLMRAAYGASTTAS